MRSRSVIDPHRIIQAAALSGIMLILYALVRAFASNTSGRIGSTLYGIGAFNKATHRMLAR